MTANIIQTTPHGAVKMYHGYSAAFLHRGHSVLYVCRGANTHTVVGSDYEVGLIAVAFRRDIRDFICAESDTAADTYRFFVCEKVERLAGRVWRVTFQFATEVISE